MIEFGQVRIAVAPSTWAGTKFIVGPNQHNGIKVFLVDGRIRYWSEHWIRLNSKVVDA